MALFHIFPTISSGLTYADYSLLLPYPEENWAVIATRAGSETVTIDGTIQYTTMPKSITGAKPVYAGILDDAQMAKLEIMDLHSTAESWMLAAENRLYEVIIDVQEKTKVRRYGQIKHRVKMQFKVVREVLI